MYFLQNGSDVNVWHIKIKIVQNFQFYKLYWHAHAHTLCWNPSTVAMDFSKRDDTVLFNIHTLSPVDNYYT